ncbi:MAG: CvpA family protein [Thermoanaerobaculaceae bacterium]|nr:CvpA family protein [Thermoanaerobaculaceae bacterium]
MDVFVLLVVCGCAVAGMIWGALRMATLVAAVAAAVLAGRWAGPAAAQLFASTPEATSGERAAAVAVVAIVAAVLVWLAGLGLRRGVKALHLGWVDRIAGLAIGAAAAVLILALLLGLAALGGHPSSSPWASRLSQAGQTFLALQKISARSAIPSSTPSTPTRSGQ